MCLGETSLWAVVVLSVPPIQAALPPRLGLTGQSGLTPEGWPLGRLSWGCRAFGSSSHGLPVGQRPCQPHFPAALDLSLWTERLDLDLSLPNLGSLLWWMEVVRAHSHYKTQLVVSSTWLQLFLTWTFDLLPLKSWKRPLSGPGQVAGEVPICKLVEVAVLPTGDGVSCPPGIRGSPWWAPTVVRYSLHRAIFILGKQSKHSLNDDEIFKYLFTSSAEVMALVLNV